MNVTVETLAPCKKLLRVDVEAKEVDAAFDEVTREFQRHVRLPGFRPGKAPRHLVLRAFEPRIEGEVRRKLMSEWFGKAVKEQHLHVVSKPEIEEIQFGRGQTFQFAARIETAPEFEMPDYKALVVRREVRMVTEEDILRALDILREQRATYLDVERPVGAGDFVVIHYRGTCEGKPIADLAPAARGLTEKKDFWVQIGPDSFLPAFTDQLVGAVKGDRRAVAVTFPADFTPTQLAGRQGEYEVEIVQVKEKTLPELDESFARAFGTVNLAELRQGVRRDLEAELETKLKRDTRDQIMRQLLAGVRCDLPESIVQEQTKHVVYDIVRDTQERGISREAIDQQRDQIFSMASSSARERVKAAFVLARIAERESIQVSKEEILAAVDALAKRHQIKPEKLLKQLEDRDGFGEIEEQIQTRKVLEFLEKSVRFEDVLPPSGTPAAG